MTVIETIRDATAEDWLFFQRTADLRSETLGHLLASWLDTDRYLEQHPEQFESVYGHRPVAVA